MGEQSRMERIRSILGEPRFDGGDDESSWLDFERSVGALPPEDFRDFVRAYGPGIVNTTLYIRHPVLGNPTLIKSTLDKLEFYLEYFPSVELDYRVGISPGQLLPFAHMMDGVDLFFLIGDRPESDWRVCAYEPNDNVVVEFEWGFSEWFVRYLEDDPLCAWLSGAGTQDPKTFSDAWAY